MKMKEFYATVNCEKFETSLQPSREPNVPNNLNIQEGPYYKEKSVNDLLKRYDCYDDNYKTFETDNAIYVRRVTFSNNRWHVHDFTIVRFKLVNIKD